jgi:DNA polymerase delta subunit 1
MESFTRNKVDFNEDLKFQVLTWETHDYAEEDSEYDPEYKIFMFGVTEKSESVCVQVDSYTPFYFALIPENLQEKWTDFHTRELTTYVKKKLYRKSDSLLKVSVVKKKKYKGFTNEKEFKFLKFIFQNQEAFNRTRYILNPKEDYRKPKISSIAPGAIDFELYESNIDPFIRFSHIQDLKTAGWITICKEDYTLTEELTRCQIEVKCHWKKVMPFDNLVTSPLVLASWDIECFSHESCYESKNAFPDHSNPKDVITQIGTSLYRYSTGESIKHCVTLKSPIDGDCDPVDGVIIERFDSEKDLIQGWVSFIEKTDPDILTGYNIYHFDWNYLYKRAQLLNAEYLLSRLSRFIDKPAILEKSSLQSSAYGDNFFEYMKMYGVTQFDLMFIVKREHKLESYSLNNVAKHFTGDEKDDLPPMQIFKKSVSTKDQVALVVKYCAQDTWLVVDLFKQLLIVTNVIAMASTTGVPMQYIELRGQQIKVHSQIAKETRKFNYLIPVIPYKSDSEMNDEDEEKFTGATVLSATPGAHFEPIAGLDFASLYPSIMIANNYCYSTIVEDPEYDNLEGVEYHDICWEEESGPITVRFVQNKEGILPRILDRLWKERKKIKKQMKEKGIDPNLWAVLNGVQLAIKVSMNSIYGFTGAKFGRLPNKRIAAAVTAEGRRMIAHSKACAEKWYDCEVVYGDTDSIYCKFKTKYTGQAHMDEVFRVAPECAARISETFRKPIDLEFEKVMYPFILFSKKRYASLFWTNPKTPDNVDYKGIQVVRRDNCEYVKKNSIQIFENILMNKKVLDYSFTSVEEVIESSKTFAREKVAKLLNKEVPMKELTLSKSLRTGYAFDSKANCNECDKTWYTKGPDGKKNMKIQDIKSFLKNDQECPFCEKKTKFVQMEANIPHVALARKRAERDAFDAPDSGDRVPYVFVTGKGYMGSRQFEKVEDPKYVLNHGIPIDYEYYFEHQFRSSLETIFDPMMESVSDIWAGLLEKKKKWSTKSVAELAEKHGITLDDFTESKILKKDVLDLIKSRE